ncbi:unnamed protein product [Rotaria socialis]|uniref:Uncharacterized protein n=1 Tax=Rotaria socialis TaxID=392032 RepID=A0A820G3P7_9BILA|nr:unnamed protein product [Rotaria socialis]CAF3415326.1 unnamed protein product [Rotaria socialis]CAF4199145.1 unnamed protein product [Rotaria socialis]CAF4273463.1 unnamed protein product [Rotaria socialis]
MTDSEMNADLSRLRSFIHHGKLKKIKNLLNNQPKRLNYFLEHEFDACAHATQFKEERALRLLHEYGFPIDGYPRTRSLTPLIIAIRRCDIGFVRTLIELGCDVNCSVRSYTIIPLIEAYQVYKNKQENLFFFETAKEIFRFLLQSGASPNVYNTHSMRLVHLTAIDGEFDLLKLLIDSGACINVITTTHRKNLLHLLCDRAVEQPTESFFQILRMLIQLGCDINQRDDCFETPLMCTLHHGSSLTIAHELIVEGTRLDLKNNFGNTYLTRAVHYALYDHARMALYAGAPCRVWQCPFPYVNRNYQQQQSSTETSLMDAIVDYERFVSQLEVYLLKPRQLKDLARLQIRKTLPCPLSKSIVLLKEYVPSSLIDYLMFKEMKTILNIEY